MYIKNYKKGDVHTMELNKFAPKLSNEFLDEIILNSTHAGVVFIGSVPIAIVVSDVVETTAFIKALLTVHAKQCIIAFIKFMRELTSQYAVRENINLLIAANVHTKSQCQWLRLVGFKFYRSGTYIKEI